MIITCDYLQKCAQRQSRKQELIEEPISEASQETLQQSPVKICALDLPHRTVESFFKSAEPSQNIESQLTQVCSEIGAEDLCGVLSDLNMDCGY